MRARSLFVSRFPLVRLALLTTLCVAFSSQAQTFPPAFIQSETVVAHQSDGEPPLRGNDLAWQAASALRVSLAPQRTVRLNDRVANGAGQHSRIYAAEVRAIASKTHLAIRVEWEDPTENRGPGDASGETNAFGDSIALEFPLYFGNGERLPYIGMGDDEQHVVVLMQRALAFSFGPGAKGKAYVAAGFGSLTRMGLSGSKMHLEREGAQWRAVFVRPLDGLGSSLRQGLVPFAVATWDGEQAERGGNKAISSWKAVRLPGEPVDEKLAAELSWGHSPGDLGDPQRGKVLAEAICAACHWVGEKRMAPFDLAPDLSGIGAYSTASYLRDSIINPNAVIVHNLNINRHVQRNATPDSNRALPNNDAFRWSIPAGPGKTISKMPAFAGLPPDDLNAIVAYLKSLGSPTQGGEPQGQESTGGQP